MLFCKKDKKKKHYLIKLMLGTAGAAGVFCLCRTGTKCVCNKMSEVCGKIAHFFRKVKKDITNDLPSA